MLATVGIVIFTNTQRGARDAKRKADIEAISKALEVGFQSDSGLYPILTNTMFSGGLIPRDPKNTTPFVYTFTPDTLTTAQSAIYIVCAQLEAGSGGNSSDNIGTPQVNGSFYCKSNQQ